MQLFHLLEETLSGRSFVHILPSKHAIATESSLSEASLKLKFLSLEVRCTALKEQQRKQQDSGDS